MNTPPHHANHPSPPTATSAHTYPPRNVSTDRPPLPIKREPASESGSAPSTPALSSYSSPTSSSPSLPGTPPPPSTPPSAHGVGGTIVETEPGTVPAWQLIPYDVPWGADFLDYAAGTLPGPEGACLFLRSPTPVEKRRAAQACGACRERKAKCSGDRPTCTRCLEKGHLCAYAPDARKAAAPRRRRTSSAHPYPRPRHRDGLPHASSSAMPSASASASTYMHASPRQASLSRSPKREPSDYSLSPVAGCVPLGGGWPAGAGYVGAGATTIHAPRPRRAPLPVPLSLPHVPAQTTVPFPQASAFALDQADVPYSALGDTTIPYALDIHADAYSVFDYTAPHTYAHAYTAGYGYAQHVTPISTFSTLAHALHYDHPRSHSHPYACAYACADGRARPACVC